MKPENEAEAKLLDGAIREFNRMLAKEFDAQIAPLCAEAMSKLKHPHFQKAVIWLDDNRVETKFHLNLSGKPKIEIVYGPQKQSEIDWEDSALTEDKAGVFVIE